VTDRRFDLVCVGNAIVDVIAHADEAFLADHEMTKGTMQLVDDDVAHALYAAMPPGIEASGGSAANTAAGVASLGGRVAFVGKVADDQLGEVFAHDLRATGVTYDTAAGPSEGPATARCLILVTEDAQRTMNTFLGVSALIGPDDVDGDVVAVATSLYCEGYLWDQPSAKAAIVAAMEAARSAGTEVAFTLSDPFCVERHREDFLELAAGHVDVLFANEHEICSLYEVDDVHEAARRVAGHVEVACITRSAHGCMLVSSDERVVAVPAVPVATVVDTTGAGDLFAAGFLHGRANGRSLEACGRLGALCAAEVIAHVGARPETSLADLAAGAGL
jgi:sugar/nucleoside kinase (ribokinase family)